MRTTLEVAIAEGNGLPWVAQGQKLGNPRCSDRARLICPRLMARAKLGKSAKEGQSTDTAGRGAWVTKYCQAHPLDLFWTAAAALVDELVKTGR
jgi:hypothetical protein